MIHIYRFGHHNAKNGVITIASEVKDNKLFYGVSFCSPDEKTYNKKLGIKIATNRLNHNILNNKFLELDEMTHASIMNQILAYMLEFDYSLPEWSYDILFPDNNQYEPLYRYNETNDDIIEEISKLNKIVVGSELAKQQLLLLSQHLHDALDTNIVIANIICHLYTNPDLVVVEDGQ